MADPEVEGIETILPPQGWKGWDLTSVGSDGAVLAGRSETPVKLSAYAGQQEEGWAADTPTRDPETDEDVNDAAQGRVGGGWSRKKKLTIGIVAATMAFVVFLIGIGAGLGTKDNEATTTSSANSAHDMLEQCLKEEEEWYAEDKEMEGWNDGPVRRELRTSSKKSDEYVWGGLVHKKMLQRETDTTTVAPKHKREERVSLGFADMLRLYWYAHPIILP